MQTPKNNLQEVLGKKAHTGSLVSSSLSASTLSSKKFNPARIASGSSFSPLSELPTFSTVGFQRGQLAVKQVEASPSACDQLSVLKQQTPSISTSIKRTSSDPSLVSDTPQPLKRPKTDVRAEKENHLPPTCNSLVKGKSKEHRAQHTQVQRAVVVVEQPSFRTGLKTSPGSQKPIPNNSLRSPRADNAFLSFPDQDRDLLYKDSETLNGLLLDNYEVRSIMTEKELAYHRGAAEKSDLTMYQRLIQTLNDRVASIKKAILLCEEGVPSILDSAIERSSDTTSISLSHFTTPELKQVGVNSASSTVRTDICEKSVGIPGTSTKSRITYQKLEALPFNESELMPASEADYWSGLGDVPIDDSLSEVSCIPLIAPPLPLSSGCPTSSLCQQEISEKLRSVFGLQRFRHNQLEAITETLNGRDVFVLMPTGGGKSLCYQLPAICQSGKTKGVTVVVSPLLALMKDQVDSLTRKKIDVFLWNSDATYEDVTSRMRGSKKPTLVYITPEKLKESTIAQRILGELYHENALARFVIDEAHCISTWGQDFREAYRHLGTLRSQYPSVPIMALTATARNLTVADIKERLNLQNCAFFTQSFNRPNLRYVIEAKPKNGLEAITNFIKTKHPGQSGVIYCLSRAQCEEIAQKLADKGFSAKHFHAKMAPNDKDRTLDEWRREKVHIIVATIAFGMGIDKANVRFVIHYSLPKSLDGYYQETGRAGRDGEPADCVLYYHFSDFKAIRHMIERPDINNVIPSRESVERQDTALRAVAEYCMNISECRRVQLLRYFDEKFDQLNCASGCDNCADPNPLTIRNLRTEASDAVQLVERFEQQSELLTLAQCRDVLKGANKADIRNKGYDKDPKFGSARDLPPELVDQLLQNLCVMDVLTQQSIRQASGFHNDYLKLGLKANEFKHSTNAFNVGWRPKAGKAVKKASNHRAAKRRPNNKRSCSNGKLKAADTDPIEAYDDASLFIESESEDPIETAATAVKSLMTCSGSAHGSDAGEHDFGRATAEYIAPHDLELVHLDPNELYKQMCDLRDNIRREKGIMDPEGVLNDTTLQLLSATCPQDYKMFVQVLKDDIADEEAVEAKFRKYGKKFLDLCIRHRVHSDIPSTTESHVHIRDLWPRFAYQDTRVVPGLSKGQCS